MAPPHSTHLHHLREQEREAARAQEANQSAPATDTTSAVAAALREQERGAAIAAAAAASRASALVPPTDSVTLMTPTEIGVLDNPIRALLNATSAFALVSNLSAAAAAAAAGALPAAGGAAALSNASAHLVGWDYFNITDTNSSWGNANAAGIRCTATRMPRHLIYGSG